jgi:thiol:disulfide interchange protein DsbD
VPILANIFFAAALSLGSGLKPPAHTQATLIFAADTAKPGDTVLAGIHLRMDPEWHTYWTNSGDSGIATSITWDLPAGITAGEIQWPVPKKLPPDDLTTYVYENEVVLLVPLKLAPDLAPGPHEIKAKVGWLECREVCIANGADVRATLNVGAETKPSTNAALVETWRNKLPLPGDAVPLKVWWEKSPQGNVRPFILEWTPSGATNGAAESDFYPLDVSTRFYVQGATQRLPSEPGKIRLRKTIKKFEGDWPKQISGLLVQSSGNDRVAYQVSASISSADQPASAAAQSLGTILLYAFIGGLILNVMPCVLPVIALKILGFVGEARNDPRRVRTLGMVYTLGVLASFLALAALVIGLKAAGHRAGWGMQFGNPQFLVVLTVLVTLVALSLFGLFEVNLGARTLDAAGSLTSKQGVSGAFFNGVLATILATPCTAPFLGVALGFAFAQSAPLIALIFLTVGFGLAFPYLLLSWQPAWLKFLPKPGAWMEKFKIAMGFPMLATAVWLFSLASIHYAERAWWLGIFLVFVGVAAWVYGEFVQRGRNRRGLAALITIALLVIGYAWVVESMLRWRDPVRETAGDSPKQNPGDVAWERWSPQVMAAARSENRPVLVDFTARWCLTCNTIVAPALENQSVRDKLKQLNARTLLADYTYFAPEITDELARYGRAGVPLVLVFPRDPNAPAIVLPEPSPLLPPSHYAGIVADALEQAGR